MKYRRLADKGYGDLKKIIFSIEDSDKLKSLEVDFNKISKIEFNFNKSVLIKLVSELENHLKKISGTYTITSQLSKMKKELKRKKTNVDKIDKYYSKAIKVFKTENESKSIKTEEPNKLKLSNHVHGTFWLSSFANSQGNNSWNLGH